MMRQELGWNLSLPNWSGNLIRLFSKWKVKISIWRKGRYLNPAPKLWEDFLCPILLGLCQRHSCLQEQQCFSVFVLFQHRSHKTIIHIFTLNPNYKSFASRTIIPFPNLTGEMNLKCCCMFYSKFVGKPSVLELLVLLFQDLFCP